MTEPTSGWLATTISWRSGSPVVSGLIASGVSHKEQVGQGETLSWQIGGPRRCVGVWLPAISEPRPCPSHNTVKPTSTSVQCAECSAADPGARVARNLVNDPRLFAVYLAWFGDRLLKVGLTASERATDRLIEQGALAFTWLARGSFAAARRLEQAVAGTAIATERITRRAKLATWWDPPGPATAAQQLEGAYHQLDTTLTWPDTIQRPGFGVTHLAATYGLDVALHADEEITALSAGAVLWGHVIFVAGHDALIATDQRTRLVDLRLVCGWTLTSALRPASPDGLITAPIVKDSPDRGQQEPLF